MSRAPKTDQQGQAGRADKTLKATAFTVARGAQ